MRWLRSTFNTPWGPVSWLGLFLSVAMMLFIWGNSLVPGTGSSGLSLTVVAAIRSALSTVGLPSAWVSNLLVRKAAHFTEYMVLGILVSHAMLSAAPWQKKRLLVAVVVLVLVPSIDETIQLFVPGRCGAVTDVMIDCSGAICGVLLRSLVSRKSRG